MCKLTNTSYGPSQSTRFMYIFSISSSCDRHLFLWPLCGHGEFRTFTWFRDIINVMTDNGQAVGTHVTIPCLTKTTLPPTPLTKEPQVPASHPLPSTPNQHLQPHLQPLRLPSPDASVDRPPIYTC
jgi:hypothetical protein